MITGTDKLCRQLGEYHASVGLILERLQNYRFDSDPGLAVAVGQLREVQEQGSQLLGIKRAS